MARPDELIGIGEFARRVRLSVKQLRSYDELGLLVPAYVDPDSAYRYYHRGQARTAITIALLRSLRVPLADVHELLVAGDERSAALLERQRARIERELDEGRRTLRSVERLMSASELLPYDVGVRDDDERELIGVAAACEAEALGRAVPAAVEELCARVPVAAAPDGPPVCGLYPLELEGEIEFFVGIDASAAPSAPRGTDRVRLARARLAVTTHVGGYEELALAYFPLLAYAHERSLATGDVVRETYIDDPALTERDRVRTEVALPVGPPPRQPNDEVSP